MRPASSLSFAQFVKRGGGVGVVLRKPKRKESFTEPSPFAFGRRGGVGPTGLRGFSSTARTEEERKLIHLTVQMDCESFRGQWGSSCRGPLSDGRQSLHHLNFLMLQLRKSASAKPGASRPGGLHLVPASRESRPRTKDASRARN